MLKDSDEKRSPKARYLLADDSNQEEDIIVTPKLNEDMLKIIGRDSFRRN